MSEWNKIQGYDVAPSPVREGIYRLRGGGFLVRGRVTDKLTGKRKATVKALREASLQQAIEYRVEAMAESRSERGRTRRTQRFAQFATSLYARKIANGKLKSAKSRERWEDTLTLHLLPAFGNVFVEDLGYADIERWKVKVAQRFDADPKAKREYTDSRGKLRLGRVRLSPVTANGWLSILRVITKQMTAEFKLGIDPGVAVEDFDTSTHHTYTDDEPNALLVRAVPSFLERMKADLPQHYAMTFLGFVTGLRPSSLRPLRRDSDVLWEENAILVRRSNAKGAVIMEKTKTGRRQKIALPEPAMEILREHIAWLEARARGDRSTPEAKRMAESEFLFPSQTGGMRSRSVLDKPFRHVAKKIDLTFKLTPRGMRRTYQDLARAAGVADLITRAVSGHATETMQQHYSTVAQEEMRTNLAKVVDLTQVRDARKQKAEAATVKSYRLRAEGIVDVERLRVAVLGAGVLPQTWNVRAIDVTMADVELAFDVNDAQLEAVRATLAGLEGAVVMRETLAPTAEYTGERRGTRKGARS